MNSERTLILIKPDGVQRRLIGEIISRFEKKGLRLVGMKFMRLTQAMARKHYAPHKSKPFFKPLLSYITSGAVMAMVWEGEEAIKVTRTIIGATFGADAAPGTIRGDFSIGKGFNLVHGSDSVASARRETPIFFTKKELLNWTPRDYSDIYQMGR